MQKLNDLRTLVLGCTLLCTPMGLWAGAAVTYSHTNGSDAFNSNSVDGTLDLTSQTYLGATYNSYHSDNSGGTINTYYLRLGHYATNGSIRLFGSDTPEVNTYSYTSAGFDFRETLFGRRKSDSYAEPEVSTPTDSGSYSEDYDQDQRYQRDQEPNTGAAAGTVTKPPSSHADPRLDFLGGYTRYMYKDQGQKIQENDITGGLGFNFYKTYLSGTFTKSVYDEEISSLVNLNQRQFNVGYAPSVIPGYPDYSYTANIDQTLLPGWWILGSYSRLKFKASPDDIADLYSVGFGLRLFKHLLGSVMYTRFDPKGGRATDPKRNYFSVGGGWQF